MRFVDTNVLLYAVSRAARSSGCEIVLSEDLADREDYDGVRVENPFRQAAGAT